MDRLAKIHHGCCWNARVVAEESKVVCDSQAGRYSYDGDVQYFVRWEGAVSKHRSLDRFAIPRRVSLAFRFGVSAGMRTPYEVEAFGGWGSGAKTVRNSLD